MTTLLDDNAQAKACNHEWVVFSTALGEVALMLECGKCHAFGTVDDPTEAEWGEAFYASSNPYRWRDNTRVTARSEGPFGGYHHIQAAHPNASV